MLLVIAPPLWGEGHSLSNWQLTKDETINLGILSAGVVVLLMNERKQRCSSRINKKVILKATFHESVGSEALRRHFCSYG